MSEQHNVKVYGKPGCVQCKFTVKALENASVPYDYIDVTINPAAENHVKQLGFSALPVVEAFDMPAWSGFKPDTIKKLKVNDE